MTNFLRITAGSFATSITTTFWDRHEAFHQTRLAETSSVYDPTLTQPLTELSNHGFSLTQSIGILTRSLQSQAYLMSSLDFFWISGWISFALIGVIMLARPTRNHGPVIAAAD
jgi:DHA2 family multidrug resistance protein